MPRKKVQDVEYAPEVSANERLRKKASTKKRNSSSAAATASTTTATTAKKKKPIKRLREKRRQNAAMAESEEKKRKKKKMDMIGIDHPGNIVAEAQTTDNAANYNSNDNGNTAEISDFYWEVEAVVGRRVYRGRVEYLIRWKGCGEEENTWEPAANLCDTAMEEAMRYVKAQKLKLKQREENEKKLFGEETDDPTTNLIECNTKDNLVTKLSKTSIANTKTDPKKEINNDEEIIEDSRWDWNDANQVIFNPVERINIHDEDAPVKVREARVHGVPIVLVGHVGWANFAQRWLSKRGGDEKKADVDVDGNKEKKVEAIDVDVDGKKTVETIDGDSDEKMTTINGDGHTNMGVTPNVADDQSAKADVKGSDPMVIDVERPTEKVSTGTPTELIGSAATAAVATENAKLNGTDGANSIHHCGTNNGETEGDDAAIVITDVTNEMTNGVAALPPVNTGNEEVDELVAGASAKNKSELENNEKKNEASGISSKTLTSNNTEDSLLDLSRRDYYLDIKKMIDDIGEEDVPVIKRNYNEENPIHGNIHAAKFLTNCWPSEDADAEASKKSPKLYLHQWQFPLSDTAGRKLCHQNNPLPKSIMGEDLLKYWLDLPQCTLDSPLQYIFMGREDTLSKLHSDPGGLDISIAPIVGEKECVLVHRADGLNCLYHLQANLNDIDLHQYPLLSQAKVWRTVIQPGEILLMPQGTYHQCRNVTPCLSYSRFHLDIVNLLPFVQSLINGDAPEIDHEEILWNLTSELISKVDKAFDHTQSLVKQNLSTDDDISEDTVETVNILRMLRHFVREVARRHEIKQQLKGEEATPDHCFSTLVDDVDMCLHEFRYRKMTTVPTFKARQSRALKNTIAKGGRKDVIATDLSKYEMGGKPVVAFNTVLEVNYMSLKRAEVDTLYPNASRKKVGEKLIGEMVVGDFVNVKLLQKVVKAEVLEIVPQMHSAYISFEDYPLIYDEWQPANLLRTPDRAEISPSDLNPGMIVIDLSNSNEYRAKVVSTQNGPMARMRLYVSQHVMERWVSADMILGKYEPPVKQVKEKKKYQVVEVVEDAPSAVACRPRTGEVVEVHRRGAAWVIKCHYETEVQEGHQTDPVPTHVDVRYILGSSSEEKMVPIGLVRLAPELDPDSGRSQRRAAEERKEVE